MKKTRLIETEKYLAQIKDKIISESQRNLKARGQNVSNRLSSSIKGNIKENKNSIEIDFDMKRYGVFQDRGVQGTESGKSFSNFRYTRKKPPMSVFLPWIKKRGLKGRDKKTGRFTTHKSLAFAIANSIYKKGIKPTLFFTKPFEKYSRKIPREIIDKYEIDFGKLFKQIEKTNLKEKK